MNNPALTKVAEQYQKLGYCRLPNFYSDSEITTIRAVLNRFHAAWKAANANFYQTRAINSAYLTAKTHLNESDRRQLFQFVSSQKLFELAGLMPFEQAAFMGTQLFFNPVNPEQKNYWHRDPQYHLSLAEQEQALNGPEVIHFRVALADEPGIEVIPGSHKNWDNRQELNVRLEQDGAQKHDDLERGQAIPMHKGDLLIFSANMIHRGLYGQNRFALDILFCEALPELLKFVPEECLPEPDILAALESPVAMQNSIRTIANPD